MKRKSIIILIILAALLLFAPLCFHLWIQSEREYEEWNKRSYSETKSTFPSEVNTTTKNSLPKNQHDISPNKNQDSKNSKKKGQPETATKQKQTTAKSKSQTEMALHDIKLRVRPSPDFEIPNSSGKEFSPGTWLEISRKTTTSDSRFSVILDMQVSDGTRFRSEVEANIFQGEIRLYFSPLSFRRLTGEKSPTVENVTWLALTDQISGQRVFYGNPFQKIKENLPPNPTLRTMPIEETPFLIQDQQEVLPQ